MTFSDLIGSDAGFMETVELARKASEGNSNILLLGESGSGKDIFAQSIHNASNRKNGPFVALNCAAIPRELIASELFGYVEGAFTGARRGGKPGKFELAGGGTIFLDEIGEMPLELQTTLLRVLESKTITPVGGTAVIPVDVRVVAATNRKLASAVLLGHFRQDLFYRLNVFSIPMAPLRNRKSDIPLLADHFLNTISAKLNKNIKRISPEVIAIFSKYSWPGNIRELQNVMERAINICDGAVIFPEHLSRELFGIDKSEGLKSRAQYETDLIRRLLAQHNNNLSRVAGAMGIARTTLYRKMGKYNLCNQG
jgi:transcriptional regulator with PAS, ATPase and Fis domain